MLSHFNEKVVDLIVENNKITKVQTDQDLYGCGVFINAAGGWARQISNMVRIDIPIEHDAHEAAISEPVQPMFNAMVVDIRERPGSSNFYFYQLPTGQFIFCITPYPQVWGYKTQNTSSFLPLVCKRLVEIMPVLGNIRVRRTWRGSCLDGNRS